MAQAIVMPKKGNSVEECFLSKWRIKEGDQISVGQIIADIETDKTSEEVEATAEGTVLSLFWQEGDLVPVLVNICAVGEPGEDFADLRPDGAQVASEETAVQAEASSPTTPAASQAPELAPAAPAVASDSNAAMSPRAKKFLAEHPFIVPDLQGSGAQGRIIEQDLKDAYYQSARMSPVAAMLSQDGLTASCGSGIGGMILGEDMGKDAGEKASPAAPAEELLQLALVTDQVTEQPLSNIRRIIAGRLHESLSSMAQYTLCAEADVSGLLLLRQKIKEQGEKLALANVNIGDMVMFAVIKALQKHPEMNGVFSDNVIKLHSAINMGFACDTPRGLMVPVLHGAEKLSLGQMSQQVKIMAKQAIEGKLNPDLLAGGTFTVSNLGAFGITSFTPVINAPELAILGVGKTILRPVRTKNNDIEYRDYMQLSLTLNHMVIDGAPGAKFLQTVKGMLENFELVCIAG